MISPSSSPNTEKKKKKLSINDNKYKNEDSAELKAIVDLSTIERESECTVIFNPKLLQIEIHKNRKGPFRSYDVIDLKNSNVINKGPKEIMINVENMSFILSLSDEKEKRLWMTSFLNSNINITDTENNESDSIKLSKKKKKLKRNSSRAKHKSIHFISQNMTSTIENSSPPSSTIPISVYPIYPRLIRISGTRNNVNASLIEPLASKLNKFDCFILDDGIENLYIWRGKSSNMFVKEECNNISHFIKDDCKGIKIIQIEQGEEDSQFWSLLGGKDAISDQQDPPLSKPVFFKLSENEPYEYITDKNLNLDDYYGLDNGYEILVVCRSNESVNLDLVKKSIDKYQTDNSYCLSKKVRACTLKEKVFVHFFEKIT